MGWGDMSRVCSMAFLRGSTLVKVLLLQEATSRYDLICLKATLKPTDTPNKQKHCLDFNIYHKLEIISSFVHTLIRYPTIVTEMTIFCLWPSVLTDEYVYLCSTQYECVFFHSSSNSNPYHLMTMPLTKQLIKHF